MSSTSFNPIKSDLLFTKNDPNDLRLGDYTSPNLSLSAEEAFYLAGYPDDEGVTLNGGRKGSALAPDLIRKYFYKMTPPPQHKSSFCIVDEGNLNTENKSLNQKHLNALEQAHLFWLHHASGKTKRITWGSGHDYGYADCKAFVDHYLKLKIKPVVINLDAHLDVRPSTSIAHSGTPFFRLLNDYSEKIDFYEIGIQPQCNSKAHLDWAISKNAKIITLDQAEHDTSLISFIQQKKAPVFLSLDMDAIRSSEAPGVSAPVNFGLTQSQVRDFIFALHKTMDLKALGIYEVNPQFDLDDKTSRLAAQFSYDFLFNWRNS